MIKTIRFFILLALTSAGGITSLFGQELFVFSEPASNMPAKSIGVRVTNEGMFKPEFASRTMGEVMIGFNKHIMLHVQGFLSDMDGGNYKPEGGSLYAKYRFFSKDGLRSHLRVAAFGRISSSNRRVFTDDINLEGDNTGAQGGFVVTQLLHKLALSGTLGYSKAFGQSEQRVYGYRPDQMLNYSISSGYLLFPLVYKNYNQPNFNLYFEALGKTNPADGKSYLDFAPAVQMIFNSRTRIDVGYRFQVTGDLENRYFKNMYLVRLELNFFNALK
jgi:hypothetical protein